MAHHKHTVRHCEGAGLATEMDDAPSAADRSPPLNYSGSELWPGGAEKLRVRARIASSGDNKGRGALGSSASAAMGGSAGLSPGGGNGPSTPPPGFEGA